MSDIDELNTLRGEIDKIDRSILQLLASRFAITREIGALKAQAEWPAQASDREAQQFEALSKMANELDYTLATHTTHTDKDGKTILSRKTVHGSVGKQLKEHGRQRQLKIWSDPTRRKKMGNMALTAGPDSNH